MNERRVKSCSAFDFVHPFVGSFTSSCTILCRPSLFCFFAQLVRREALPVAECRHMHFVSSISRQVRFHSLFGYTLRVTLFRVGRSSVVRRPLPFDMLVFTVKSNVFGAILLGFIGERRLRRKCQSKNTNRYSFDGIEASGEHHFACFRSPLTLDWFCFHYVSVNCAFIC